MAKDFLLEIGTEPMPARFVAPALEQLEKRLRETLERLGVAGPATSWKRYGTLRRLAVLADGLADKSPDRSEDVKGPPERLLKDAAGAFTPQSAGFARKCGLSPEQLRAEKGFLWARVVTPGEKTTAILARELPLILKGLEFPKSLEWEASRFRFGRPIRSITALLGSSVVAFEVAGVESARLISGLAALQEKPVSLKKPADYVANLRERHVLADVEERRDALLSRLKDAAAKAGGAVDLDESLVDETVFMAEQPTPVVGSFSADFLQLPDALLSLVLKRQLKFFPVLEGARLKASFVGVRDGLSEGESLVREGYERVLAARGNDALFFFRRDLATRLEDKLPMLERVTYQRGLGSMTAKTRRVEALVRELCAMTRQDRPADERAAAEVARLCYADLVTEVVKEFPELQGAMGGVYARRDGLDERVALGLEHFYLPVGPKSPVPATLEGAIVSLAGKLDSLVANFAVGNIPTGNADPFALRRQALGAVRITLEQQLPIDLTRAVAAAAGRLEVSHDTSKTQADVLEFLWGRAQSFFEEKGFRVDEIRAVKQGGLASLKRTYLRLAAIHAVRANPDFEPLAAAFKRASNILRQARFPLAQAEAPDRQLLREPAETALFDALLSMEGQVSERLGDDDYETGLRALVGIKPHLDLFFDKVMVMVEDAEVRSQRLRLLAKLVRLFNAVADLSEIQSPSSN